MEISRRHLFGGVISATTLAALAPMLLESASADILPLPSINGVVYESLLSKTTYPAYGTAFTRDVTKMPVASNSKEIAAYMPLQPAEYQKFGVVTSFNTTSYNLPMYIVDSSDPKCPTADFTSTDPRVIYKPDLIKLTTGVLPCPLFAIPAGGGDRSFSVFDKATGLFRDYFYCVKTATGWNFSASGYIQAGPNFSNLNTDDFWMQMTTGSSSVVAMLNDLTQIGIAEVRSGEINHAVSFTIANAKPGFSFPAKQGDGSSTNPNAPLEGQWFRFPPSLNLDSLGLNPLTLMVAKAAQKYGGYPADKNVFCHAFNLENPINLTSQGLPDPWAAGGDIFEKYPYLRINDFPWDLTEWGVVDWKGMDQVVQPNYIFDDNFGKFYSLPTGTKIYKTRQSTGLFTSAKLMLPYKTLTSPMLVSKYSSFAIQSGLPVVAKAKIAGKVIHTSAQITFNQVRDASGTSYFVKDMNF